VTDGDAAHLPNLRTVQWTALFLGISPLTVYRLLRSGKLKGSKVGGQWRISDEALRDYLEQGIHVPIAADKKARSRQASPRRSQSRTSTRPHSRARRTPAND
jgi:excisionase family DNA binding protein